jgi:hypothetical protein
MEKIKFAALMIVFAIGVAWSVRYVHDTGLYYSSMLAPAKQDGEGALSGPPVVGKFIEIKAAVEPPVGKPREADMWEYDVPGAVLTDRKATMSDIKSVFFYIPERCMKCHQEEGPGNHFYGNGEFDKFKVFKTEDGLELFCSANTLKTGSSPTLKYVYKERHLKKVPFDIGAPYEVYMNRGY